MLGTVGTGARECVRCGAVGAAGVGVGAASGAVSAALSPTPSPPTIGALSDVARGPGKVAANGVGSGPASGATSDGASVDADVTPEAGVLLDKLLILLKLSRSLVGLGPRGEYESAAPAAPVEPGV